MATTAATVIAVARRKITSHFMSQNAVSAQDAVPFEPRGAQKRQFARMLDAGVVEEAKADHYWLNIPAYDAWKSRARKRVAGAMGLLAVAGALAAIFAG